MNEKNEIWMRHGAARKSGRLILTTEYFCKLEKNALIDFEPVHSNS